MLLIKAPSCSFTPNAYVLFRQPIHIYHSRNLFPGKVTDAEYDYEDLDLMELSTTCSVVLQKELGFEDFRQQGQPVQGHDDSDCY